MADLFDVINDIDLKEKRSDRDLKEINYKYLIFAINRHYSMDPDYLEIANIMNILNLQDERLHFDFYSFLTTKGKKYFKYIKSKKEKNFKEHELCEILANIMQIKYQDMKQYLISFNEKQIKELKLDLGGKKI